MPNLCEICSKKFEVKPNTSGKYCSISCSNIGRNGVVKQWYADNYNKSPSVCGHCDTPLTYDQHKTKNKYCSHGCAASAANPTRVYRLKPEKPKCENCGWGVERNRKYCSHSCIVSGNLQSRIPLLESGEIKNRATLKRVLFSLRGRRCEECGTTEWRDLPVPIELHHMDGNAGNNFPENLQLLCPNCHAQTDTAKGKNIGNGRGSRGTKIGLEPCNCCIAAFLWLR